jgi:hypothetical protein
MTLNTLAMVAVFRARHPLDVARDRPVLFVQAISIVELLIILLYLGHVSGCFFYFFSNPQWRTANERHLFSTGQMESWVQHQFGGERHLEFPSACSPPPASAPQAQPNVAQDPQTGQWYTCPVAYALHNCSNCAAPPFRCHSYYGVYYRCARWVGGCAAAVLICNTTIDVAHAMYHACAWVAAAWTSPVACGMKRKSPSLECSCRHVQKPFCTANCRKCRKYGQSITEEAS